MATDITVNNLIINKLSKEQYDAIEQKSETELYLVPDEMDNIPTSGSSNAVTSDGIYKVIHDNELTIAAALNDLNDRKANLSYVEEELSYIYSYINNNTKFTEFASVEDQTTQITIGNVTKSLKINADTLDNKHLNELFESFTGGTLSSNNNILTQSAFSISIGGKSLSAGESNNIPIINSANWTYVGSNSYVPNSSYNLVLRYNVNGIDSSYAYIPQLYAFSAYRASYLDNVGAYELFTFFGNGGNNYTDIIVGGKTRSHQINAAYLQTYTAYSLFQSFTGGTLTSDGINTLTQNDHTIQIGGHEKKIGSSSVNIINSLKINLSSNATTNLSAYITANGYQSNTYNITDLISRQISPTNITSLSSLTNSNNLIYGYYSTNNTISGGGVPSNVRQFGIISFKTNSSKYGQILISSNTNQGMYWRNTSDSWKKILDSSNYTEYTYSKSDLYTRTQSDERYVNVYGDTMNGILNLKYGMTVSYRDYNQDPDQKTSPSFIYGSMGFYKPIRAYDCIYAYDNIQVYGSANFDNSANFYNRLCAKSGIIVGEEDEDGRTGRSIFYGTVTFENAVSMNHQVNINSSLYCDHITCESGGVFHSLITNSIRVENGATISDSLYVNNKIHADNSIEYNIDPKERPISYIIYTSNETEHENYLRKASLSYLVSQMGDNWVSRSGDTMTGALKRYYATASDNPMIALTSNEQDVWLWRINSGTSATTSTSAVNGFGLKYKGSGTSNADKYKLILAADNHNGQQVDAMTIDQLGQITLSNTIEAPGFHKATSSNTYVLLGGGGHELLSNLHNTHNHNNGIGQTAWGQQYVNAIGTLSSIDGDMSNVGNITPTSDNTYTLGTSNTRFKTSYNVDEYIGTETGSQCHLNFDDTHKCLRFTFD